MKLLRTAFTTAVLIAIFANMAKAADPPTIDALAAQIQELQKQVAELQAKAGDAKPSAAPRILAAGTANWQMGVEQNNRTTLHVKLDADIAAKLGDDSIVLLTPRLPAGGYPFFVPYWKPAKDGFDLTLIDVTLGTGTSSYLYNKNKSFPVDWAVVKKTP